MSDLELLLSGVIQYAVAQAFWYPTKVGMYWVGYSGSDVKMRTEHKLFLTLPLLPDLYYFAKMVKRDGLVPRAKMRKKLREGKP